MNCLALSGIYELFIPGVQKGALYKYEIKSKGSLVYLKSDPYGNQAEMRPDTASIVADLNQYSWEIQKWMKERRQLRMRKKPMAVYEMHLGTWKKPEAGRNYFIIIGKLPLCWLLM